MSQPDHETYVCQWCLRPVESVARESHDNRHADFIALGLRRNVWTPGDKKELARMQIQVESE